MIDFMLSKMENPQNQPFQHVVNIEKGNVSIIIAIIGIVLLLFIVGGGAYYLGTQKNRPLQATQTQSSQSQPSPTSKQPYQEPTKTTLQGSFQDILEKNCEINNGNLIDVSKVPVSVDPNIININNIVCFNVETNESTGYHIGSFMISSKDKKTIIVYDKNSKPLGAGRDVLGLSLYETVIKDDGNIKLTVGFQTGDMGLIQPGKDLNMIGQKRLKLSNGDIAYANYSTIAIKGDDKRLFELLNSYSKPCPVFSNCVAVDNSDPSVKKEFNEALKSNFFSDLSNLQGSAKDAIAEIERVLGAVSPK